MNDTDKNCVVFFVKYPAAGQVKTRLAPHLQQNQICELYKNFVADILSTLKELDANIEIFFSPVEAKDNLQNWLGDEFSYTPQAGSDIGQKMKNAFINIFRSGFSKAVLIGSDLPDLPGDFIKQSFEQLGPNDSVIGPVSDGGYYLIGFAKNSFLPEAFDDINWSTDSVYENTRNILEQYNHKTVALPKWHDIDTIEDLKAFISRNENTSSNTSKTFAWLKTENFQTKKGSIFNANRIV